MKHLLSVAFLAWGSTIVAAPLVDAVEVCTDKSSGADVAIAAQKLAERGWRLIDTPEPAMVDGYYMQYQNAARLLDRDPASLSENMLEGVRIMAEPQMRMGFAENEIENNLSLPGNQIAAERLLVADDNETQIKLMNQGELHCWLFSGEKAEFADAARALPDEGLDRFAPSLATSRRSDAIVNSSGIGWAATLNRDALTELMGQPVTVKYALRIYQGR